jgi:hypothetical protein
MKNYPFIIVFILIFSFSCKKEKATLFTRISTDHSGIDFNNKIVETDSFNIMSSEYIFNGGGVAIGDFNNDDKPDVFFTGNQVTNKLYINKGNLKFKDVSEEANIEAELSWNTGVSLVDINNDNLLDIYVCSAMLPTEKEKANLLFVNQGTNSDGIPKFKEMASDYGIAGTGNSMGATFFDYDKDGHLDLYVLNNVDIHVLPANYRKKITDGSALSNDRLYHNNGDGSFSDVTLESGITIEGYGLGLAIADLNHDGWPDIYVSNDYLTNDLLYINNQDGTFTNEIKDFVKHQSKFSMGSDIADYNNDGFQDIITLDMLGETNQRLKTTIAKSNYTSYVLDEQFGYEHQYSRNMLQKGNGIGVPYSEIGLMAGVAKTDWSWSPIFVDMDNDGFRDLLITNGFPRDITDLDFGDFKFEVSRFLSPAKILDSIPTIKIANYAYKYDGNNKFTDVSNEWGLDIPSFSNGAAYADLDNDGDLDYIVNNINDPAFIFENNLNNLEKPKNNYLYVKLKDLKSETSAIGSKVVARFEDGSFQFHEHYLNRGYMSSVQNIVHFGLGDKKSIKSLEILWPDGAFQKLTDVTPNHTVTVDRKDAIKTNIVSLEFPFSPKKTTPIFKEISKDIGVEYTHKEKDKIDFNVQRVLPHKLTQNGPCLSKGDINGDGFEDFIVGSSSNNSPELFVQDENGNFTNKPLFTDEENMKFEEESITLFDLENDGDLDLYLVSGSNEFDRDSGYYLDRLLINDGAGNFEVAKDKMPNVSASGSVVIANDFDDDGFVDLFIGGRTPFAQYPLADQSFLLKNHNGILKDVTETIAPGLKEIGMVTDAVWSDFDLDGLIDLIVIGEYMPITFFKNEKSQFRKLNNTGIENHIGWWETIVSNDFDKDGDMDYVVGNMGANNFYQPSEERPITIISKDFDSNGTVDPIMFAYFKNNFQDLDYNSFPVNFWGDLYGQSPLFRAKFKYYKDYAKSTQNTLFTEEELEGISILSGNFDKSIYIENIGDGKFKSMALPSELQVAPINGLTITDFNNDKNDDILLIGNDYGNEVFIGRYDALNGGLLKGDGKGGFEFINADESGFLADGDAKDIITLKPANNSNPYHIVSQNRGDLLIFQKNEVITQ